MINVNFLKNKNRINQFIIFSAILVVLIFLGYFVYLNYNKGGGDLNINKETNKPSEITENRITEKKAGENEIECVNVDEKFVPDSRREKRYDLKYQYEYKIGNGIIEFNKREDKNPVVELFYNGRKIYEFEDLPLNEYYLAEDKSLWCFSYKDYKYLVINSYSGGTHCCASNYIFVLKPKNDLKYVSSLMSEHHYLNISTLMIKNNKIYIKFSNYLGYFRGPYSSGFPIKDYYLLNDDKIIDAHYEFKEEYLKKAKQRSKECFSKEESDITCIGEVVYNYLRAGEEKIAQETAEKFFNKFPDIKDGWGNKITLEEFMKEVKTLAGKN
jgi:hypothetical protein